MKILVQVKLGLKERESHPACMSCMRPKCLYARANAGGWDDSAYSLRGSILELPRERCCWERLLPPKRANLDHLMKAGIVPGKQQCGLLYIDAYLTH